MNYDDQQCCSRGFWVYAFTGLGTFLIMGLLVWAMIRYTMPPPVGAARAEERQQTLAEINAAEAEASKGYVWQDREKGFVRLPVDRAMQLMLQEWQNPKQARAQLLERVEKATYVPPPPPEQPSEFE